MTGDPDYQPLSASLMSIPQNLWRFPTEQSILSLAARLNVAWDPGMQDWEWEIAESSRLDEYLSLYRSGCLTSDERFTLLETIMQAFEDLPSELESDARWHDTLTLLDTEVDLHACTIWYWSDLEDELGEESWRVTPFLRKLVQKHQCRFDAA